MTLRALNFLNGIKKATHSADVNDLALKLIDWLNANGYITEYDLLILVAGRRFRSGQSLEDTQASLANAWKSVS